MSTAVKIDNPTGPRVVVGQLQRVRRGKRTAFEVKAPKPAPEPRPARVALTLAFAHEIQRAIDAGEIRDQVEAAQRLGMTRARVTQLLDLTLLDPRIQELVLGMEAANGTELIGERALRAVARFDSWSLQEAVSAAGAISPWSGSEGRGKRKAARNLP